MVKGIAMVAPVFFMSAMVRAQVWCETFETGAKSFYAAGDVSCVMGSWQLADGLLGSAAGDRYFGTQAVRLRTGKLEMNFDKTNGVETLSAYVGKFGTDADSTVAVECSKDGSNTWFQVGSALSVTSVVLKRVSLVVHTNGNVRFRFSKEGTGRINIDNIVLTDFGSGPIPPIIDPAEAARVRVGQVLSLTLNVTPTDDDPVTATNVTASAGVTGAWALTNGVFIYTPSAADTGQRSFTFTASDKDGTSLPMEVPVKVLGLQTEAVRLLAAAGRYTQGFDGLAVSGQDNEWDNAANPLPAWYGYANGVAVESYRAGTGSGTSGGLYAFGAEGSTNRSLGSLAGSGNVLRYGVAFTNETGLTLTNLTVSFTAAQWRVANGGTNTLTFEYCITNRVQPLSQGVWVAVPALCFDSTAVTNAEQASAAVYLAETRCATISEPVPAGAVAVLRWSDPDDAGSDHAFGIDDLAVTWAAQRERGGTALSLH